MNLINQISIPKPCHQAWNNMTENQNGRYCGSCSKTVIDFSAMSDQQIIEHLASTSAKVCGRFDEQQFSTLNNHLRTDNLQASGFWKRMVLAVTMLMGSQYIKAQTVPVIPATEQGPSNFILGKVVKVDTIKYKTITGCITDVNDKSPLPGVTIKAQGVTIGTQTNVDGFFKLNVPESVTAIAVSYIGYDTQIFNIRTNTAPQINIALKSTSILMGEVVITRTSFTKRMYYRFIKRPIRKIFG